jgi:hypothetical protein
MTDRSHVPWRRPQEAHPHVIDRPGAIDGQAAHDLEVITDFYGPELQLQGSDRPDFQSPVDFNQAAGFAEIDDPRAKLSC